MASDDGNLYVTCHLELLAALVVARELHDVLVQLHGAVGEITGVVIGVGTRLCDGLLGVVIDELPCVDGVGLVLA